MADKNDEQTRKGMIDYLKKSIVYNIMQAARILTFGYYLNDDGRWEGVSPGLEKDSADYYARSAVRDGKELLMELGKNLDYSVEEE